MSSFPPSTFFDCPFFADPRGSGSPVHLHRSHTPSTRLCVAWVQFVLGSHLNPEPPSVEMNAVPTVAGVGVHERVVQVPCPAGSAVIYDSRTYHRACPELNTSGEERIAMLNCKTRHECCSSSVVDNRHTSILVQ